MLQLSGRALTASAADGALFVDRDAELSSLARALRLGFNVFLSGPPGSGVTSTLHRVQAADPLAAFVSAAAIETLGELIDRLTTAIASGGRAGSPPEHEHDPIAGLRDVLAEVGAGPPVVVVLDGLSPSLRHELFGRQRDELWELSCRWVVTGHSALRPPADAFFEVAVSLGPLVPAVSRALLERRAATGTPDERRRLEELAVELPPLLGPTTPRLLLSVARTVMLSDEPEAVLAALERQRDARDRLSGTERRVLDALDALGPTHAGDERLLTEIGTTRSRVAQVLKELEARGLVVSAREGRRRLYGPSLEQGLVVEDAETGERNSITAETVSASR